MSISQLFLVIMLASVFSFGGLGSLPVLQSELSAKGISPDAVVLPSLAVGNISPGPNGLYLIAASYFIKGVTGSLVACVRRAHPAVSGTGRRTGPAAIDSPAPFSRDAALACAGGGGPARRHRLVAGQTRGGRRAR